MSVASHLGIDLSQYDARIRTFIPDYEEMLTVAASCIPRDARAIVDLGVGTGALAARCVDVTPRASVIGIDSDREIMALAARRLGVKAAFVGGSFLRAPIPPCDAVVASFSLHHIRTRPSKAALYRRVRAALRPGGVFVTVDCQPARDKAIARGQRDAWLTHLRAAYSAREARGLLRAWSHEDVYVPLEDEMGLMNRAGFRVEVLWRRGAFAVLRAAR